MQTIFEAEARNLSLAKWRYDYMKEVARNKQTAEVIADSENLSGLLLKNGLARRYDIKRRKRTFCAAMVFE